MNENYLRLARINMLDGTYNSALNEKFTQGKGYTFKERNLFFKYFYFFVRKATLHKHRKSDVSVLNIFTFLSEK